MKIYKKTKGFGSYLAQARRISCKAKGSEAKYGNIVGEAFKGTAFGLML
jgi:hypothetical protein